METKMNKEKSYFNVSIPHDDRISVRGSPTPAIYNVVRDESIISGRPVDYNMSVVRFTIPTSYIPVQFFPVIPNPTDPLDMNYGLYSITLSYLGNDYTQHLRWIPQNTDTPIPPPPTPSPLFIPRPVYTEYYSLYSFNHLAYLLNNAFTECFNTNIVPLLPAPPLGKEYRAPLFQFDGSTFLFSLFVSELFLEDTVNNIEIYFNTAFNTNFDTSFHCEFYDYTVPEKNVRYLFIPFLETNRVIDTVSVGGVLYKYTQEYDSSGLITSFKSVIIRSNTLPLRNEGISIQGANGQISTGTVSVITDFEIDQGSLRNQKNFIHYVPSAEYRRIDMLGNSELKHIALEILWSDRFDNLFPVLIPAHDKATIKLYFEEK